MNTYRNLALLLFLLSGCTVSPKYYPKYSIAYKDIVPDSLAKQHEIFVIETVRAASYHMTGGDYEDPEDLIEEAYYTFKLIHAKRIKGLGVNYCHGCYQEFINPADFTDKELKIFNELSNGKP